MTDLTHLPPQNHQAELAVCGVLLTFPEYAHELDPRLKPDDFFQDHCRDVFRAFSKLRDTDTPIDSGSILDAIRRMRPDQTADEIIRGFSTMMEAAPHAGHLLYHSGQVIDSASSRRQGYMSLDWYRKTRDPSRDPSDTLAEVESAIAGLTDSSAADVVTLKSTLLETIDELASDREPGILTGLSDFDDLTGGLPNGGIVVPCCRPGMGKTAALCGIAAHVAKSADVLFFTLEMQAVEIAKRLLAQRANCAFGGLRRMARDDHERPALMDAAESVGELGIHLCDQSRLTVSEIGSLARTAKRKHGIRLVIIDYLQLIEPSDPRAPREQQVATVSRGLKSIAKSLNLPVVVASQFNRSIESRQNRRPQLSDLRESGAIEQDAHLVFAIDRPHEYDPDSDPTSAHFHVLKNRNGRTGSVLLRWDGTTMTFHDTTLVAHGQDDSDGMPDYFDEHMT